MAKTDMLKEIERVLTTDGSPKAKSIELEETEAGCFVCTSHKLDNEGYLRLGRNGKENKHGDSDRD